MKKWMLSMLVAAGMAAGQGPEAIQKIVELKYLDGEQADRAIRLVQEVADAKIVSDSVLKKIIIKGLPDRVAAAEQLLRSLDTPDLGVNRKRLDISIRVVGAFQDGSAKSGGEIPADIEPAIKEMRASFSYKSYTLLDTVTLSGLVGGGVESAGRMTNPADSASPLTYSARFGRSGIDKDSKSLLLNGFDFQLRLAGNPGVIQSRLGTDVLIRQGQKLVLGNLRSSDSNTAIFLILSAKVD